jgi:hypothetical protein
VLHDLIASFVCEEVPWPRPFGALQRVDLGSSKPAGNVEIYDGRIRSAFQAACMWQSENRLFRSVLPARMIDLGAVDGQWIVERERTSSQKLGAVVCNERTSARSRQGVVEVVVGGVARG